MDGIFGSIISFIIALSVVVAIHELGHLFAAKLFGIGVTRFSIGFGKRLFGIRIGETDYCVSMIPLGGYVRLAGDESLDKLVAEPKHLNSHPIWQRIIVYIAGPLANLILAMLILFVINVSGYDELRFEPAIGAVEEDSAAAEAKLEAGDYLVSINGTAVETWNDVSRLIVLGSGAELELVLNRDGEELTVFAMPKLNPETGMGQLGIRPAVDSRLSTVTEVGEELGLRTGDRVVGLGEWAVKDAYDFDAALREVIGELDAEALAEAESIPLLLERSGEQMEVAIPPLNLTVSERAFTLGGEEIHVSLDPLTSIGMAAAQTVSQAGEIYQVLYLLISQRMPASKAIGGAISIAAASGKMAEAGLTIFLRFVAYLSVMLGVMNTLPIPILDGGHISLLILEKIRRKPLSLRSRQVVQLAGLAIIIFITFFGLYADISRLVS
ncbi:RIP metalloprotease RseP [bacterium]|nr:RIP metalloprotease RseP [bacterium]